MTGRKKTEQERKEHKFKGWGGAREGGGRPKQAGNENSRNYTFRAGGEVREFLDALDCRTDFIKECVRTAIKSGLTTTLPDREGVELPKNIGEVISAEKVKGLTIPMFDLQVACGLPVDVNTDEHAEMVNMLNMVCPHPERCYMIRVIGESMKDANIHSGDVIVVDRTKRDPSEKEIAICELNGEYTVKHVRREGNHGWLIPENKDFQAMEIKPDDRFSVWGTVKSVIHNV